MRKSFLLALVTMLLPLSASAETVTVDGVRYVLNDENGTASVTYLDRQLAEMISSWEPRYSGSVYIPSQVSHSSKSYTVTSIGSYAFYLCKLTNISLPNTITRIDRYAFANCTIPSITIPGSVTSVSTGNSGAFVGSDIASVTISYGITSIARWFEGCELESVSIPNSVTDISGAFKGCENLKSVIIPNSLSSIGESAFRGCCSLQTVTIPDNVSSIEELAFCFCTSLTSITIPNSVASIGKSVFEECSSLSSVTLPDNITRISDRAFWGCAKLTSITIPESVEEIGTRSFEGCGLTSVTLPNSIKKIGGGSFVGLKDVYCLCDEVPEADYSSFGPLEILDYDKRATLHVKDTSIELFKCAKTPWKYFKEIVPIEKVTDFNLTYYVDGTEYKNEKHKYEDEIIPEKDPTKKGMTFSGWSEIPEKMPGKDVDVNGTFSWMKVTNDNVIYQVSDTVNNCAFVIGNEGVSGDVKIASDIDFDYNYKVVAIANGSFNGCKGITTIDMPSTITSIGERAFAGIDKLTDVAIMAEELPTTDRTAFENSYIEDYVTLHVPGSAIKKYKETAPWKNFKEIVAIPGTEVNETYKLTYIVDGEVYKVVEVKEGETITAEDVPTKEGYTFSGWGDIPDVMPSQDVTVSGTFTINKYKLVYMVDGVEYKSYDVEYNSKVTPEEAPTKEGHTFSGWSEIPESMPAKDVTVSGTFTVNKYKLIYTVDGESYKEYEIEYGTSITAEVAPEKEGYTFSGWSEIPGTMPAKDVTVSGSFTVNKYKLVYIIDGEEYKTIEVEYGSSITPEEDPTKEGYVFSGWSEIPETMPAKDVTVTGSFSKGTYTLTYIVDGETYKTYSFNYGDNITPEAYPEKEGYTFSGWENMPETMPAGNVTVSGYFTVNKYTITYYVDGEVYKTVEVEYGSKITAEEEPTKEGYDFSGWSWMPSKMPAEDVTVTGSFTKASYEVDGFTYQIDEDGATLTSADYAAGDVVLDATVTINGKTYRITVIGEKAFKDNDRITSLTIPDVIETIMPNAFDGCSRLLKLILGKNVRYIGSKAFAGIGKAAAYTRADTEPLTIECYSESVPKADSDCFDDVDLTSAILRVDDNLTKDYKFTSPWNKFGTILGFNDKTSIISIFDNEESTTIFSIDGRRLDTPHKGLNIIRTNKGAKKMYRK